MNTYKVYVTVYNNTQAYGGPEEGGWWYMEREPLDSLYTLCCGATGSSEYTDQDDQPVTDTWLLGDPSDHAEDCPARGAAETYHRRYVLGHTETYLRSFTHRPDGVSWVDSDEDGPAEYQGERATNGTNCVRIESEPPQHYPQELPHYE